MSKDLFKKITKTALGISAVIWLLRKIRLSISNPTVRLLLTILVLFAGFTYTKYFALEVYKDACAGTLTFSRISEIAAGQPVKAAPVSTSLNEAKDVLNGNIDAENLKDSAVTSAKILDGTIVNADVNASAAITYSKLSLTNSILNADVNSAAGIVYSKLALTDNILNADINSAAAIGISKIAWDSTSPYYSLFTMDPGGTSLAGYTIGGSASVAWKDVDMDTYYASLDTILPSKPVIAIIEAVASASNYSTVDACQLSFRPNGSAWDTNAPSAGGAPRLIASIGVGDTAVTDVEYKTLFVLTDTGHIFEYYVGINGVGSWEFTIMGFIPCIPVTN